MKEKEKMEEDKEEEAARHLPGGGWRLRRSEEKEE